MGELYFLILSYSCWLSTLERMRLRSQLQRVLNHYVSCELKIFDGEEVNANLHFMSFFEEEGVIITLEGFLFVVR